ncbi:hypothetical protein GCWU000342_00004 [Shuttleworthella satelles DSM 14600]|uniref:Uncharacterized protein n=1 Tax=Shuttleworthella satelles DSM 14600 TaxID=626523 RepID=C4GA85_9FIRM|nr:hypothetical protein GCWU000342_00004 [Shuttleworthia satelles DSM 14600]
MANPLLFLGPQIALRFALILLESFKVVSLFSYQRTCRAKALALLRQ